MVRKKCERDHVREELLWFREREKDRERDLKKG